MGNNKLWKESKKQKITPKDILYGLIEAPINALLCLGEHRPYRVSAVDFYQDERFSCEDLAQKIYRLKKNKLIRKFVENNVLYMELTDKGKKTLAWEEIDKLKTKKMKWDGRFRLAMFDVPEDKKTIREMIRRKLETIGFVSLQKSVYIFPHECNNEINAIAYYCGAGKYLKYMVVNIVEGEEDIVDQFIDRGIIELNDIK